TLICHRGLLAWGSTRAGRPVFTLAAFRTTIPPGWWLRYVRATHVLGCRNRRRGHLPGRPGPVAHGDRGAETRRARPVHIRLRARRKDGVCPDGQRHHERDDRACRGRTPALVPTAGRVPPLRARPAVGAAVRRVPGPRRTESRAASGRLRGA